MKKVEINSFFEYDKKDLFAILLDLLSVFDSFCKRHNLEYYAQGGTMLGAVRHQGFIPWDDDIDLAMMRSDFDRLLSIIETEELQSPYKFLTPLTDKQYYKGIVRLCNSNTTAISVNNAVFDYNHGIFIDIFPLDSIPDNKIRLGLYKIETKSLLLAQLAFSRYCLGDIGKFGLKPIHRVAFKILKPFFALHLIEKEALFKAFSRAASKYKGKGQKRICLSTFMVVNKYINYKTDYEVEIIDMPFENTTIPVPATYDRILRNHYGDDYMTPVHEKTMHGDTLFATTIPYKEFVEMYHDELIELWLDYRKTLH